MTAVWIVTAAVVVLIVAPCAWLMIWIFATEAADERDPRLIDPDVDILARYAREMPRRTRRLADQLQPGARR